MCMMRERRDYMREIPPSRWVIGLSQHPLSAISSLIVADWPLRYILQNFTGFFPSPLKFQ